MTEDMDGPVDDKTEISIDNNPDKKFDFGKFRKTLKGNPWMVATGILVLVIVIGLVFILSGGITGNIITGRVIGGGDPGQIFLDFAVSQGVPEDSIEVVDINNKDFYEIIYLIDGRESSFYMTKDTQSFLPEAPIPFSVLENTPPGPPSQLPETTTYSGEDIEKIKVFVSCLETKGVKIYGANWCGWTKKLVVDTLGGFDIAAPIYVECTEEEALCSQEGVSGYPTIKINGEVYKGERSFEGLAQETTCAAPDINTQLSSDGGEASCN